MQQFAFVVLTSGFAFFSSLSGPSRLSHPPPLFSSPGLLSPCPSHPPSFLFLCLLCVSLLGLHDWVPGAPIKSKTRPRLQHILDTPSRPLTCAMGWPRQFQAPKVPRFQSRSHWLGWSACSCLPPSCVLPAPETKCYAKSKCRLSTATIMPIAVAAQDISPQGGGLPTTQTHQPANQRKAVACRTHIRLGT